MQKVQSLEHLPGCCRRCFGANSRAYIDMEIVDDFHGRVYYCYECVREMSNTLGFVTPEQLTDIKETHDIELEELRERVKRGRVLDWLALNSIDLERFIRWLEHEEIYVDASRIGREESETNAGRAESSDEPGLRDVSISF